MHPPTSLLLSLLALVPIALTDNTPAPTANPSWITGLNDAQASAYDSFGSSLSADTKALSSISSVYATATSADNFDGGGTSVESVIQAAVTATTPVSPPELPSDMPKEIQSYYSSAYKAEISLLQKQRTNTATGNGAAQETAHVKIAGMAVAGVFGAAVML